MFGYSRGAFTGARQRKTGYFKEADGGTLFIDDLENMSAYLQQKLLTVVDERKIHPLGSTSPISLDVRLITATNKDVKQSVKSGEFRNDLYYRLGEFVITLPPLRERKKEIPSLAQNFLMDVCAEMKKPLPEIDGRAITLLKRHSWPGNLRELKNVMRRAAVLSSGNTIDEELASSLLSSQITSNCGRRPVSSLKGAVKELEARMIKDAIDATEGNKSKASELLSISYPTLLSKIKEYDIK